MPPPAVLAQSGGLAYWLQSRAGLTDHYGCYAPSPPVTTQDCSLGKCRDRGQPPNDGSHEQIRCIDCRSHPPWGGNWCGLEWKATTAQRQVYGTAITAQCGGCSGNTPPHGNWGVDSFFSNRIDGSQYKGWAVYNPYCQESFDDPEWNSCTRDFTSSTYYNDTPPFQYSPDETDLGTVWDWYSTTEEEGCSVLDGVDFSGGTVLEIWELDHWGPLDDHVTDLQVFSGSGQLTCGREGCTPVATSWGGGANGVDAEP